MQSHGADRHHLRLQNKTQVVEPHLLQFTLKVRLRIERHESVGDLLFTKRVHDRDKHLLLGGEVVVKRRLGTTNPTGYLRHRGIFKTALDK